MTSIIVKSAKNLGAQTKIQSQVAANFPVILREESIIVGAVFVVIDTAAAKTELWRTQKKILEIGITICGVSEEQLAIENLWK